MREPITRVPLTLLGEYSAATSWYHCGWCGDEISDDPWATMFHELGHTLSEEEVQEIIADHEMDVKDRKRAGREAQNSSSASADPAQTTKSDPNSVVGDVAPWVTELAAKRALVQTLHERRLAIPFMGVVRVAHAINSGHAGQITRAIDGLNLSQKQVERLGNLIARGNATPAEVAEAILGGPGVQVWLGAKDNDAGLGDHTQNVKHGLIDLQKAMKEIEQIEGISEEERSKLKAEACEDFFEDYSGDLQDIIYNPPPEYKHFIPLKVAKEWDDLLRALKIRRLSERQSKDKPVSDNNFKPVVLIALLLLVLLALFDRPNPAPHFLPASPGYVLDTHTGVVYDIDGKRVSKETPASWAFQFDPYTGTLVVGLASLIFALGWQLTSHLRAKKRQT
jgi:hypothetical protein